MSFLHSLSPRHASRGFTLIEILVVLIIILILSLVITDPFSRFRARQMVELTASETVSFITSAREDTVSGKNEARFGVHFESDSVVLFTGDSLSTGTEVARFTPSDLVTISTINLADGSSEVVFEQGTGRASTSGTIVIEHDIRPITETIMITSEGLVTQE